MTPDRGSYFSSCSATNESFGTEMEHIRTSRPSHPSIGDNHVSHFGPLRDQPIYQEPPLSPFLPIHASPFALQAYSGAVNQMVLPSGKPFAVIPLVSRGAASREEDALSPMSLTALGSDPPARPKNIRKWSCNVSVGEHGVLYFVLCLLRTNR